MKTVKTLPIKTTRIQVPGSKSISHRALICASLASGTSRLENILNSDDIRHTRSALGAMGAGIEEAAKGTLHVSGFDGAPSPVPNPIYLGNSGTSMRLLSGVAALGKTPYTLAGDERMHQRPMEDLLCALRESGVDARADAGNGCPPITINGIGKRGGRVVLDCSQSSQYLSSLLMAGPLFPLGLDINLAAPAVSAPYIHLTLTMMRRFGVDAQVHSDVRFLVPGNQNYRAADVIVEPDLSNASYFWAAGAVTGTPVTVDHVSLDSDQGDVGLLDILQQMGCRVRQVSTGVEVTGHDLIGVDVDMSNTPDVVPTLAVIAAFAKGKTTVRNIAHLREKECDRIHVVVTQLEKMGISAEQGENWLSVTGGNPKGALIETYNDHRMAMAFSIAGLRVPGVSIENPACVAKSFPSYWETFEQLYA